MLLHDGVLVLDSSQLIVGIAPRRLGRFSGLVWSGLVCSGGPFCNLETCHARPSLTWKRNLASGYESIKDRKQQLLRGEHGGAPPRVNP